MKGYHDGAGITGDLSFGISDMDFTMFRDFCGNVLGTGVDDVPSERGIFMKQCLSLVFYATILFMITNGVFLVKNNLDNATFPVDMVPLYMMIASSALMLVFVIFYRKYDSPLARFALLAYYTVIIASVTIFMVSCNFHSIGLSVSMCYLFLIMIAPTYDLLDTVIICILIFVSWWLPGRLPYAENYDLFKHFLLRFSIVVGFIVVRSIFLRQAHNVCSIAKMSNSFIKLAYNDMMTGSLNKKAMEAYRTYLAEQQKPAGVSVIIFDIDFFKSYNDHYSHMKGDEALRCICQSVIDVLVKSGRYLFRFGGEEFVVILPDASEEEACALACQLLEAVRTAAIARGDLPDRSIVTASFGVAGGTCHELSSLSIMSKADKQLYICKNSGRDCVSAGGVIHAQAKEDAL